MLPGARRGPKPSKWKQSARASFDSFFAKRSGPLKDPPTEAPALEVASVGLSWLFNGIGAEPVQVHSPVNGPVRSVVLGTAGLLIALGFGKRRCPRARRVPLLACVVAQETCSCG